jgi:glycine/D-amino acid oxidase-like deaminating enzyme
MPSVTSVKSRVFTEPARTLPVLDRADVVVAGGGPGGIAAAIAAARGGAKVILVERFGVLGGTWTSGLLGAIMPFPFVRGLFTEVIDRLRAEGAWREGYGGTYEAEAAKTILDRMVIEAGVRVYFFASVVGVMRDGTQLTGLVIESKEGRHVIAADWFVDSSGDGDVAALAGVPFANGREEDGARQPMTMIFRVEGIDEPRAEAAAAADPHYTRAWQAAKARGEITVPREDVLTFPSPRPGQWFFNTTRIIGKDGTKLRDVSDAMLEGRRQVAEIMRFVRAHVPGFENALLAETASHIGVRESRRIYCDYTVTQDDILTPSHFADGIARGNWFIDIHSPTGEGTVRLHPPEGAYYEIPYRATTARGITNLWVSSRCVDSTHAAHAAIRITPQVFAIGQGVGAAAAQCVHARLNDTREVDVAALRATLRSQGAFI